MRYKFKIEKLIWGSYFDVESLILVVFLIFCVIVVVFFCVILYLESGVNLVVENKSKLRFRILNDIIIWK